MLPIKSIIFDKISIKQIRVSIFIDFRYISTNFIDCYRMLSIAHAGVQPFNERKKYFHVMLFVRNTTLLSCTTRFYLLSLCMKPESVTIERKAIEQYSRVVLSPWRAGWFLLNESRWVILYF